MGGLSLGLHQFRVVVCLNNEPGFAQPMILESVLGFASIITVRPVIVLTNVGRLVNCKSTAIALVVVIYYNGREIQGYSHTLFLRMLFFRPRLNILIFFCRF